MGKYKGLEAHLIWDGGMAPKGYGALRKACSRCEKCRLSDTRRQVVFDRGNPSAKLMFISEAPGAMEDQTGECFVGDAGQQLDLLIEEAGLAPESYLICSVLKCRPPGNIFPGEEGSAVGVEAVRECLTWLDQQLALVKPKVVVMVGKRAAQWTLYRGKGPPPPMREMMMNWYRGEDYPGVEFFAMYHTSFLLRRKNEDPELAEELEDNMRVALQRAAHALDGRLPKKIKPVVVPAISFKRSKNQTSLF